MTAAVPSGDAPRRARLGQYAFWQLRDYLLEKGIGTSIVLVFAATLFYVGLRGEEIRPAPASRGEIQFAFAQLLSNLVLLGALFATNGIVSDDRKHGYYRFLFAKPVSVPRFYAQKFLVHLAGFMLVCALLLVAFNVSFGRLIGRGVLPFAPRWLLVALALLSAALAAALVVRDDRRGHFHRSPTRGLDSELRFHARQFAEYLAAGLAASATALLLVNLGLAIASARNPFPFLPTWLFPILAVLFLALGGVGFLMSVVWRVDWLSFMAVYIVSNVLWGLYGSSSSWQGMLVKLLPPVHKLDGIYLAMVHEQPLPTSDITWLTTYGLACFGVGLIELRRRPLASS